MGPVDVDALIETWRRGDPQGSSLELYEAAMAAVPRGLAESRPPGRGSLRELAGAAALALAFDCPLEEARLLDQLLPRLRAYGVPGSRTEALAERRKALAGRRRAA